MTHPRIPSLPSRGSNDKAVIFSKWKLEVLASRLAACLEKQGEVSQILGKLSVLKFLKPCLSKSSLVLDKRYYDEIDHIGKGIPAKGISFS